jgi:hypothetical protein
MTKCSVCKKDFRADGETRRLGDKVYCHGCWAILRTRPPHFAADDIADGAKAAMGARQNAYWAAQAARRPYWSGPGH